MNPVNNMTLIAALDLQYRHLDEALSRLEIARAAYLPGPANFWRGPARHAYDAAVSSVVTGADVASAVLREARDQMGWAATEARARG